MSKSRNYLKSFVLAGATLVFLGSAIPTPTKAAEINRLGETQSHIVEFTYDFRDTAIMEQMELVMETEVALEVLKTEAQIENTEAQEIQLANREWESVDMELVRLENQFSNKIYVSLDREAVVTAHSQMDANSTYTGKLYPGSCVELIGEEENWYLVRGNGFEGYVQKSEVLTGLEAAETVAAQLDEMAVVTTEYLNIRKFPSVESECVEIAVAGNSYKVLQEGSVWCLIQYGDDTQVGYVSSEFVSLQYDYEETISAEEEARRAEEERRRAEEERRRQEEEQRRRQEEEERRRQEEAERNRQQAAAAKEQQRLDAIAAQAGLPAGSIKSLGVFRVTHYCTCTKCTKGLGLTATGTVPVAGRTVAIYPSQIPYGSTVVLNGHAYVAEDCGGGVGMNCIDVYVSDHDECIRLGMYYEEVFVRVR